MIQHAGGTSPEVSSLRTTRLALGISLRSVASKAGIHPAHLSRIERGEAQITVDSLYRLAVVLELSELARQLHPHLSRKQQMP